jgi:hypothetical protein
MLLFIELKYPDLNNLFGKLKKNPSSKNISILVQITRKSCVPLNDSNFNCHLHSKK